MTSADLQALARELEDRLKFTVGMTVQARYRGLINEQDTK